MEICKGTVHVMYCAGHWYSWHSEDPECIFRSRSPAEAFGKVVMWHTDPVELPREVIGLCGQRLLHKSKPHPPARQEINGARYTTTEARPKLAKCE